MRTVLPAVILESVILERSDRITIGSRGIPCLCEARRRAAEAITNLFFWNRYDT